MKVVESEEQKGESGRIRTQCSISSAAERLSACLSETQDLLENFYEEEQILFQAGIDFQEFNIKYINDAIINNISNL